MYNAHIMYKVHEQEHVCNVYIMEKVHLISCLNTNDVMCQLIIYVQSTYGGMTSYFMSQFPYWF